MFRLGGDIWGRDVMGARPIGLGQQICTLSNGCGEATSRDQAQAYSNMLSGVLLDNPSCFQGEDIEYANALLSKLQNFLTPPQGAKLIGVMAISDDEKKILDQATGCQRVYMVKPGQVLPKPAEKVPQGSGSPSALPGAPALENTNLLPVALGAAGALALIYALMR